MPTIPTIALSQLKPLPNTPDPVLDREKRPTMDLSGVMQAAGRLGKAGMMPDINPAPFVAEAGALDAVGRAVTQAGGILEAHAMKRMEAKNDADLADAELALKNEQADFENWKMENPNPDTWGPEWERRGHEALQTQLSNEHLSRSGREALALQGKRWLGNSLLDVSRDSTKATYARAASSVRAEYERAVAAGDFAGAEAAAAKGEEKGYFFPHQAQAMREGIVEKQKEFKRDAEANVALSDPEGWLAHNKKPAEGQSVHDYMAIRNVAEGAARDDFHNAQKDMADFMATNPLATPEAVASAAGGRLRPGELAVWQGEAAKRLDATEKARRASPEFIRQKYGELLDKAEQFSKSDANVMDPKAREVYADLHMQALQLPENLRGEITGPLERKWRQEPPKIEGTVKEYVQESLKDFFNQGAFGALEKRVPKVPGDEGYLSYKPDFKTITDVEGRAKAQMARADATLGMEQWMKANPKATRAEATAELYRQSGGVLRMDEASKLLKGADKATTPAAVPAVDFQAIKAGLQGNRLQGARVTSFGYDGDTTPDANSSAGIAAFTTEADAKAGRDAPTRLKDGDLAVSPDVEDSLRAANVRPGDVVEVTFEDGTTHKGRWLDRTAQDAQILAGKVPGVSKVLRGRIDIYSRGGKHAKDGVKVVSFNRA